MSEYVTHTPGPWGWGFTTIDTGTGAHEGDLQLVTRMPAPKLNDPVILTVREDWKAYLQGAPEGQANARLIAAAPDLLAACLKFVESYKSLQREKCDIAHRMALDALAKVEGQ